MVGGVSIGAFMGALWCQERNITTQTQKAREWSKVTFHIFMPLTLIWKFTENDTVVAPDLRPNLSNDVNV